MPDNAELKEFIESVICPEIQSKINDTGNLICSFCQTIITGVHHCNGNPIYLPTIDQLLEILGDRLYGLFYRYGNKQESSWECQYYRSDEFKNKNIQAFAVFGQSGRCTLARAAKEILK